MKLPPATTVVTKRFLSRETVEVAKGLLGAFLVHHSRQGTTVGRIVETEAYLGTGDPACHAARGKTPRNSIMFGPPGYNYVYFIYGMYYCYNIVTGKPGVGEAVLIRALEPISGIPLMKKRRKTDDLKNLCSGPGKLVLAMGIDKQHNGLSILEGPIQVVQPKRSSLGTRGENIEGKEIISTSRIGIKAGSNLPLRFLIRDSVFVSRPAGAVPQRARSESNK